MNRSMAYTSCIARCTGSFFYSIFHTSDGKACIVMNKEKIFIIVLIVLIVFSVPQLFHFPLQFKDMRNPMFFRSLAVLLLSVWLLIIS